MGTITSWVQEEYYSHIAWSERVKMSVESEKEDISNFYGWNFEI